MNPLDIFLIPIVDNCLKDIESTLDAKPLAKIISMLDFIQFHDHDSNLLITYLTQLPLKVKTPLEYLHGLIWEYENPKIANSIRWIHEQYLAKNNQEPLAKGDISNYTKQYIKKYCQTLQGIDTNEQYYYFSNSILLKANPQLYKNIHNQPIGIQAAKIATQQRKNSSRLASYNKKISSATAITSNFFTKSVDAFVLRDKFQTSNSSSQLSDDNLNLSFISSNIDDLFQKATIAYQQNDYLKALDYNTQVLNLQTQYSFDRIITLSQRDSILENLLDKHIKEVQDDENQKNDFFY